MKIEILDGFAFFAEQKEKKGAFYLTLPKEAKVFLNGRALANEPLRFYRLFPTDLREGENTLSLYIEGASIPCQGLLRHNEQVTPFAFPTEKLLLALLHRQIDQEKRQKKLEDAHQALQKEMRGATLF
ncbi:MAG: hypothetical protein J6K61_04935 [Clostridia bacterium]|nr:hypothetical protein [Clostridia bacterium]